MLAEGGAFCQAGNPVTMMQTPCSINHSVSPSMTRSAAPVYGADANPRELQSDHGEQEVLPEVPESVEKVEIDGEEKKEEVEMRKPRVGDRPRWRPTTRCI